MTRLTPTEALISVGDAYQTVSNSTHTIQDTTHVAADVERVLKLRESRRHDDDACTFLEVGKGEGFSGSHLS